MKSRIAERRQWFGEVAERLNAPHSKCGIRATVSGGRIPPFRQPRSKHFLRLDLLRYQRLTPPALVHTGGTHGPRNVSTVEASEDRDVLAAQAHPAGPHPRPR